jgi:hypothetical protein
MWRGLALVWGAAVVVLAVGNSIGGWSRGVTVWLRGSDELIERLEVSAAVIFWFQQIEGCEYVVDGRVTIRVFRKRLFPWSGVSCPLIQFLYTRDELSVLSL